MPRSLSFGMLEVAYRIYCPGFRDRSVDAPYMLTLDIRITDVAVEPV